MSGRARHIYGFLQREMISIVQPALLFQSEFAHLDRSIVTVFVPDSFKQLAQCFLRSP